MPAVYPGLKTSAEGARAWLIAFIRNGVVEHIGIYSESSPTAHNDVDLHVMASAVTSDYAAGVKLITDVMSEIERHFQHVRDLPRAPMRRPYQPPAVLPHGAKLGRCPRCGDSSVIILESGVVPEHPRARANVDASGRMVHVPCKAPDAKVPRTCYRCGAHGSMKEIPAAKNCICWQSFGRGGYRHQCTECGARLVECACMACNSEGTS